MQRDLQRLEAAENVQKGQVTVLIGLLEDMIEIANRADDCAGPERSRMGLGIGVSGIDGWRLGADAGIRDGLVGAVIAGARRRRNLRILLNRQHHRSLSSFPDRNILWFVQIDFDFAEEGGRFFRAERD